MAIFALTSTTVSISGTDISSYLKSATLAMNADQLDTTDFASGGWKEAIAGLKAGTLRLEFMDDFVDDGVDEDFWGYFNTGTNVTYAIKPTSSAISTGNPEYQGNVVPISFGLGGAVGSLAGKTIDWPTSGAPTRDVTP